MKAAVDIARRVSRLEISKNLIALTSFYQAHDLESWTRHMRQKNTSREVWFVAEDPMPLWAESHRAYLGLIWPRRSGSLPA